MRQQKNDGRACGYWFELVGNDKLNDTRNREEKDKEKTKTIGIKSHGTFNEEENLTNVSQINNWFEPKALASTTGKASRKF